MAAIGAIVLVLGVGEAVMVVASPGHVLFLVTLWGVGVIVLAVGLSRIDALLGRRIRARSLIDGGATRARVRDAWILWGTGVLLYFGVGVSVNVSAGLPTAVLELFVLLGNGLILAGCVWYAWAAADPGPAGLAAPPATNRSPRPP